ncbi:hypothetical protein PENSPDRAFT_245524 [Peniophora sp. CONT]|nr:hypothetical protein PENSPDRAFT_245524 [Peniophora sp. CONT]
MTESTQYVNIVYFSESSSRLENFEKFRTRYVKTWGHLLNEHGLYWGREVGKHERLWSIIFLKDGHSQEQQLNDPAYQTWETDTAHVMPVRLLNVPTRGAPLHEVLQAGIVVLGHYKLAAHRSAARFDALSDRFLKEVDSPGFRGGTYISPTGLGGEAFTFGAWDSVEAAVQLGADNRHADLLAQMNEAFDATARTFIAFVKFQKHVIP